MVWSGMLNHSVPAVARNTSEDIVRKTLSGPIWLRWAMMAARLAAMTDVTSTLYVISAWGVP